jgi:uncharacterized protein YbjT (DUF2867 family)
MILVVGATGQLGTAVCTRLASEGYQVRALVRPGSRYQHLGRLGVELILGDLLDPDSVRSASRDIDAVVATANASLPRQRGSSFDAVEGDGYFNLLRVCRRLQIERFVFVSVPVTPYDDLVPTFRYKRLNEERLRQSGLPYTIVRTAPFMDEWLALLGSGLPLRGEEAHTLRRGYWFSTLYMAVASRLMDVLGVALVPGHGWTRHPFVAVEDVARYLVEALFQPAAADTVLNLGGPEILTWNEAVDACSRALGRTIRKVHVPAVLFRLHQVALSRLAPAASNLMGLSWVHAEWATLYEPAEARPVLDTTMLTTVEQFVRTKAALAGR